MKKNIAKVLCVLLVLVMMLSLAACGETEQDKLIGTWEAEVELASAFNASLGDTEDAAYLTVDSLVFKMVLVFNEDGTYSFSADEASVTAAMEGLKEDLMVGMEAYLVDTIAATGMEMTIDEIMEAMGTTLDALVDSIVTDDMIDEMVQTMITEGNFKAEDGKLYMSESLDTACDETYYDTYTLDGTTLTLVEPSEPDEMTEYLYPMVFTKAA